MGTVWQRNSIFFKSLRPCGLSHQIGNYSMTYEEMTSLMESEYDSPDRQTTAQAEIERICPSTYMSENNISSL